MADPVKGAAISLSGRKVTIEVFCLDDYEAILFHDELVAKLKADGSVAIQIGGAIPQKQRIDRP